MTGPAAETTETAKTGRVVVRDGLARRPAQRWTSTVHVLLHHLHDGGAPVPEPVSLSRGTEVVTALPGEAGDACWPLQATDAGLVSFARLLRRVHDASRSFVAPADACWALPPRSATDGLVVCHGDAGPWNATWVGGEAVGLFDWDLARPGPALDDVTYALSFMAPFADDAFAARWLGFTDPPDRPRRIRQFVRAYGGWPGAGAPVDLEVVADAVADRMALEVTNVAALGAEGVEPQRTWVEEGRLDLLRDRVTWAEEHRHLVTG